MNNNKLIGNKEIFDAFQQATTKLLKNKQGSVLAVKGEEGFGKSYVLNYLSNQIREREDITVAFADNQSPISEINIGHIQPLEPFAKIVRQVLTDPKSAKKKFVLNLGMTTLASLPFVGDIFYAVKEYGRDWREYKRDKSSQNFKDTNQTVADFYDTLAGHSDDKPIVIFIDNMHFADELSLKLLEQIIKNIAHLSILLVFTYQEFQFDNGINNLIKNYCGDNELIKCFDLKPLDLQEIREFCKQNIRNFKPNAIFEEWLYEKTKGVPGLLAAYAEHFKFNPPFDDSGNLKYDLDNKKIFPENAKNALLEYLEQLSDKEINILGICAAEGMEFSAYLVSHLLRKDIITTIKILRSIQNKVNIIESLGPKIKYGIKTTAYRFTQEYYYKYFDNLLEYEERLAIHGQIAAFLKSKMDETPNNNLKQELAPFIAAHSIVSGDDETAKRMLVISAQAANEIDGKGIIENAYQAYQNISSASGNDNDIVDRTIFRDLLNNISAQGTVSEGGGETGTGTGTGIAGTYDKNYPIDFAYIRRTIVDEYHKHKYDKALELINTYTETHKNKLKPSEESQLFALAARCYIEMDDLDSAKEYTQKALTVLEKYKEPIPEAFAFNVQAIIYLQENKIEQAFSTLKKAAKISINLPPEIKLITLANIALILKTTDAKKAEKYFIALRKLTNMLNYEEFAVDIFK